MKYNVPYSFNIPMDARPTCFSKRKYREGSLILGPFSLHLHDNESRWIADKAVVGDYWPRLF